MKLINVIRTNEPIRIPTIPLTGNDDYTLICFIVVDNLVVVVNTVVVFTFWVDWVVLVIIVRNVGIYLKNKINHELNNRN